MKYLLALTMLSSAAFAHESTCRFSNEIGGYNSYYCDMHNYVMPEPTEKFEYKLHTIIFPSRFPPYDEYNCGYPYFFQLQNGYYLCTLPPSAETADSSNHN